MCLKHGTSVERRTDTAVSTAVTMRRNTYTVRRQQAYFLSYFAPHEREKEPGFLHVAPYERAGLGILVS